MMVVAQPLAFWRPWTQCNLDQAGPVSVAGALAPLVVDLKADVGHYVEPNVWVVHHV